MTNNEYLMALGGNSQYTVDGRTRIRYLVADALNLRARERRGEGRPDVAGRLLWLESRVRTGQAPTKRVVGKLNKDLEIVRQRLVDGVSIGQYPAY